MKRRTWQILYVCCGKASNSCIRPWFLKVEVILSNEGTLFHSRTVQLMNLLLVYNSVSCNILQGRKIIGRHIKVWEVQKYQDTADGHPRLGGCKVVSISKIFTDVSEEVVLSPEPVNIRWHIIPLLLPKTGFKFSGGGADISGTAMTELLGSFSIGLATVSWLQPARTEVV